MDSSFAHKRMLVVQNTCLAVVFCSGAVAAGTILLPQFMSFPTELAGRLAFGVKLSAIAVFWVLAGVVAVSLHRFRSPGEIAGAAYAADSRELAVERATLQNTVEQSLVASSAYALHASVAGGEDLSLTLSCAVLFAVGRLCFYYGYVRGASGRSFGMATTALSTMIVYAASLTALFR